MPIPCLSGMYPLSLQADARCELCKFTLTLLDGVLKKDDPKLNQTLTNLCNSLPDTYKSIVCSLLFFKKTVHVFTINIWTPFSFYHIFEVHVQ